jgi:hypothetical protein
MQTAVAALPPTPAAAPEPEVLLAAARDGRMSLQELMAHAQALQSAGRTDAAAQLYETWINGHRFTRCARWPASTGARCCRPPASEPAAEAAYRRALACSPALPRPS